MAGLLSAAEVAQSPSRQAGMKPADESRFRFAACDLINAAGQRMKMCAPPPPGRRAGPAGWGSRRSRRRRRRRR